MRGDTRARQGRAVYDAVVYAHACFFRWRREFEALHAHPDALNLRAAWPMYAGIGTIVTALIRSRKIFRRLETYIVSGGGMGFLLRVGCTSGAGLNTPKTLPADFLPAQVHGCPARLLMCSVPCCTPAGVPHGFLHRHPGALGRVAQPASSRAALLCIRPSATA